MADAVERLGRERVVAILRVARAELVEPAVAALAEGGLGAIELTFTTPGVEHELRRTRERHPQLLLGAGTVRSADQARAAVEAGADFLVMPHLDLGLLEDCLATGLPAVPGVLTPSELAAATGAGAGLVKLFPAGSVGIAHMRALFGPFPGVRILPTGGIAIDEVATWLDAGAHAVGIGGEVCPTDAIEARRFEELTERARALRAALP